MTWRAIYSLFRTDRQSARTILGKYGSKHNKNAHYRVPQHTRIIHHTEPASAIASYRLNDNLQVTAVTCSTQGKHPPQTSPRGTYNDAIAAASSSTTRNYSITISQRACHRLRASPHILRMMRYGGSYRYIKRASKGSASTDSALEKTNVPSNRCRKLRSNGALRANYVFAGPACYCCAMWPCTFSSGIHYCQ